MKYGYSTTTTLFHSPSRSKYCYESDESSSSEEEEEEYNNYNNYETTRVDYTAYNQHRSSHSTTSTYGLVLFDDDDDNDDENNDEHQLLVTEFHNKLSLAGNNTKLLKAYKKRERMLHTIQDDLQSSELLRERILQLQLHDKQQQSSSFSSEYTYISRNNVVYNNEFRQVENRLIEDDLKESEQLKRRIEERCVRALRQLEQEKENLQSLINREEAEAKRILSAQSAKEEEERKEREKVESEAAQKKEAEDRRKQDLAREEKEKSQQVEEEKKKAAALAAKESEYITEAQRYMSLIDDENSKSAIQEFDTSKEPVVKKQRLGFKKLVKTNFNILTGTKVAAVADALAQNLIKEYEAGGVSLAYLIDLLASNAIMRASAETFSNQAEGFPLGHTLALVVQKVSSHAEQLSKILCESLAGHLYSVCPSAIPLLPVVKDGMQDEDLFKALGMLKKKTAAGDGVEEYESFNRFLDRTEGLISLCAAAMSTSGNDNQLFGGNEGALKWLQRFLSALPPPPTMPLALTTAPVLTAFLTMAGHMLAKKFPQQFESLCRKISNDIIGRLDESPIGAPSAQRLKKVMKEGFLGFQSNLPDAAVNEFYENNTSGKVSTQAAIPTPRVRSQQQQQSQFSNPFAPQVLGAQEQQQQGGGFGSNFGASSPFGDFNHQQNAAGKSPFQSSSGGTSTPFGSTISQDIQSTFPQQQQGNSMFRQSNNQSVSSAFCGKQIQQNFSPFGQTKTQPQEQTNPFGQPSEQQPNPFGQNQQQSLGQTQTQLQEQTSPFGQPSRQQPNPFGQNQQPSFGQTKQQSPFGQSNSFGSNNGSFGQPTSSNNLFMSSGGNNSFSSNNYDNSNNKRNVPPCKFFKQGKCRNGQYCKFSHELGSSQHQQQMNGPTRNNPFASNW